MTSSFHRKLSHRILINNEDYTRILRKDIEMNQSLGFDIWGIEDVIFRFSLKSPTIPLAILLKGIKIDYFLTINGVEYKIFSGTTDKEQTYSNKLAKFEVPGQLNYELQKSINVINKSFYSASITEWFSILVSDSPQFNGRVSNMPEIVTAGTEVGTIAENIRPLLYPYLAIINYDFNNSLGYVKSALDYIEADPVHTFTLYNWNALSLESTKLSTSESPTQLVVKGSEMNLLAYCNMGDIFGEPVGTVFSGTLTGKEIKPEQTIEIVIDTEIYSYALFDANITIRDEDSDAGSIIGGFTVNRIYVNSKRELVINITNSTLVSGYLRETVITVNDHSRTPFYDISRTYKKTNPILIETGFSINTTQQNTLELESNIVQTQSLANGMINFFSILKGSQLKFKARGIPNLKCGDKIRIELTKDNYTTILLTEIDCVISFDSGFQCEYKGINIGDISFTDYLTWGVNNWGVAKWF